MSRDSRHDGVSCDSCLKGNFRGRRYKCLICYDYDLCDTCYEAGATTSRHTIDHPMQCILTRTDFGLYYGGETLLEQPQSFTCPFCAKMGFTESTLQEHVSANHTDVSSEVVCPVCASQPQGEPNHVTDDFAAHLSLEHRAPRDLISFHDEPAGSRHVRRIPHPGRGVTSSRARRTNMHFGNSSGVSVLSPGNRESMDPIAELLSQLSGVRRVTGLSSNSTSQQNTTSSQLQQLQVHLQLERQQAQMARQHLERLPRRQAGGKEASNTMSTNNLVLDNVERPPPSNSMFLLARYSDPVLSDGEQAALEVERADHSQFMQELLLSALSQNLVIDDVVTPTLDDSAEAASSKTDEATAAVTRTDSARSSSPLLPVVTQAASDSKLTSSNTVPSVAKSTGETQQRTGAKRNPRRQGAETKKKGREPPPPHPK